MLESFQTLTTLKMLGLFASTSPMIWNVSNVISSHNLVQALQLAIRTHNKNKFAAHCGRALTSPNHFVVCPRRTRHVLLVLPGLLQIRARSAKQNIKYQIIIRTTKAATSVEKQILIQPFRFARAARTQILYNRFVLRDAGRDAHRETNPYTTVSFCATRAATRIEKAILIQLFRFARRGPRRAARKNKT